MLKQVVDPGNNVGLLHGLLQLHHTNKQRHVNPSQTLLALTILHQQVSKCTVSPDSPRVSDPKGKTEPDSVPEPDVVSTEPEPIPSTEDLERKRKETITEKRRQSLILVRNKITPKKQIRKEKDMEIEVKDKVIPEKLPPKPRSRPANPPKERSMTHHQSTEHLVNQSYAEQLQMRLREQMLYRMMSETFM
jgi:hypothetical protein